MSAVRSRSWRLKVVSDSFVCTLMHGSRAHRLNVSQLAEHEVIQRLTALIERDDDMFVAQCAELDIASQGTTIEEALANLREALELFFETASQEEVSRRMTG